MGEIFIPILHSFENGNTFSGSDGLLRFMLTPAEGEIHAQIWHGIYCLEKSEIELEQTFPLSEEGLAALRTWLAAQR